jgi:tripartite-type tricarboxylate transporter receptor subunit TctC
MCPLAHGKVGALVLALAAAVPPAAAAYPEKPVRIIVPFAPGGNVDINARTVAPGLTEILGQPFLVDNRGGAAGRLGTELVAKAPPDGYTLLLASSGPLTLNPVFNKVNYDTLRDFAPLSIITTVPLVLSVHPSVPARTVRELIALAKARPGKLTFCSAGTGGTTHMTGEFFQMQTGIKLVHVPYKGSGPALIDLIGGQVDMIFDQLTSSSPHIASGRLRALAVSTLSRSPFLPNVPTMHESGAQRFEVLTYTGLAAPAATPKEILRRLYDALTTTLRQPATRDTFARLGAEVQPTTPERFSERLRTDLANWSKVRDRLHLKLD